MATFPLEQCFESQPRIKLRDVQEELSAELRILQHAAFVTLLRIQAKRSERSGQPFMLMLLSVSESIAHGSPQAKLRLIIGALRASVRDTDVMGWYETGSVLGLLFAEIGSDTSHVSFIQQKINATLRRQPKIRKFGYMDPVFQVFQSRGSISSSNQLKDANIELSASDRLEESEATMSCA